jgi:hypothetical protein
MLTAVSTFRSFLRFYSQPVRTLVIGAVFGCLLLGITPNNSFSLIQSVQAAEVRIAGYTNGAFNTGTPPNTSATQTATLLGLTYVNSTFDGTTAGGFRGIGGNPTAPPAQSVNNLGSISLATTPATYTGNTFTLRVTFTAPQGITGSNTTTFTATLTGTVISDNSGGVLLDFNNTPILFTFNDTNCEANPTGAIPGQQTTCGNGSFLFSVNDVSIDPGQTVAITGQITSAQQSPITTAATVSISGRVMTMSGRGIMNVRLSLTDSSGEVRTATTTSFGYYRFDDVQAGETYILSATGKHYTFSQPLQVLNINEETDAVNFIANSEKRFRSF